jgi:hypothetical protein
VNVGHGRVLPAPYLRKHWRGIKRIEQLVKRTKRDLGHKDVSIVPKFDGRLRSVVGQANWSICGAHHVRFSTGFWILMTSAERRETIIHEVCHITSAVELGGATSDVLEHCPLWHEHMAHVGYPTPTITLHVG